MGKFCVLVLLGLLVCSAQASWYWPFGSDDDDGSEAPRLSVLMEPATVLIDEASDLAADGKTDEAVAKYRQALLALDQIERENPERAATSEFATLRNKRAYVNAAIDSMLLSQVKGNAKAVAVSDTTELERKLAEERGEKPKSEVEVEQRSVTNSTVRLTTTTKTNSTVRLTTTTKTKTAPARALTKREQAMADIAAGDYAAAEIIVQEMLVSKPNNALALNLKATMEACQGKLKEAERTLDQTIMNNPRDHFAYYNMAILMLRMNPDNKASAKRFYETGRTYGGPKDAELEALFK